MKTNIKLRVTPEQSEAVRKICFANDFTWLYTPQNIALTGIEDRFLGIKSDYTLLAAGSKTCFTEWLLDEVDADLFIRTNGTCEESIDTVDNLSNNKSKEDMFKQYGFEVPNFECKIAGSIESILYGAVWIQLNSIPGMEEFGWYPEQWDIIDGMAHNDSKYDLTPIKQPWYETCKYPVIVKTEDSNIFIIKDELQNYTEVTLKTLTPLSNEEIDQLKQDF